eukprot:5143344-Prymnesium_polylepis.1
MTPTHDRDGVKPYASMRPENMWECGRRTRAWRSARRPRSHGGGIAGVSSPAARARAPVTTRSLQ